MKYRRFGKTELQIPVISCGGMRFQESWNSDDPISDESQRTVQGCVDHALELGINHFETARGYGTSEEQLGRILPALPREDLIVQTKVAPMADLGRFKGTFEKCMRLLKLDYIDLFSFHGINNQECIENTKHCLDTALQWQREGRIRHIGFSTHGGTQDIVSAIEMDCFDYVNLHWYYVFQDNWPAIEAATARDMGVFIISPNDKGGKLYDVPDKLVELTAPLHPMVFNGLFCLSHPEVHTLSCGVSKASDFDLHMETVEKLDQAADLVAPIVERLEAAMAEAVGEDWAATWQEGLPDWSETPGDIHVPWILRLRNLALAYDMTGYAKMRYNLLGNGGHWFPGNKADKLDDVDLTAALSASPHAEKIPGYLAEAHAMLAGEEVKRLQES
jgi:predicted aldo/keto reductase-like oxidoreductase